MGTEKQTWLKPRHKIITSLLRPPLKFYCRLRYGITFEQYKEQGDRPYLILYNHQTPFDQFFIGCVFGGAKQTGADDGDFFGGVALGDLKKLTYGVYSGGKSRIVNAFPRAFGIRRKPRFANCFKNRSRVYAVGDKKFYRV